jgi:hypothetical protein
MARPKSSTPHTCNGGNGPRFGAKTPGCHRCDEILGTRPVPPAAPASTKHSAACSPPGRGPGFRRTPGCPRCAELDGGAPAREAHAGIEAIQRNASNEQQTLQSIRDHNCTTNGCGTVCTAHDW